MSFRGTGLGQYPWMPVCQTPYFGPYPMESGSPCPYKDNVNGCCDPTDTVFGTTPPLPPGNVNLDYGSVHPTRTCMTPFYSSMYGDVKLYNDIQGLCDPTNTNTTAPGLGLMNTSMVLMIMGGLAVLVVAASPGGGGGSRRRR